MKELKSTQKLGKTGQEKKIFSLNMEVSEMTISRMVEVNFQKWCAFWEKNIAL